MKNLSRRMLRILDAVPNARTVCDVGCDHGYIGCALLELGRCERVVFSDVSAPSLAKAQKLARKLGFSDRSEFVLGAGLSHARGADVAVVAGLGGREIGEIVKASPEGARRFVLQPMKNGPELRDALAEGGFRILRDEKIADADRFYDLITAELGEDALTAAERRFGRTNLAERGRDFLAYLRQQQGVYSEVLENEALSEETAAGLRQTIAELERLSGETTMNAERGRLSGGRL